MKRYRSLIVATIALGFASFRCEPSFGGSLQLDFVDQLSSGQFAYPVIESGPLAGQPAQYQAQGEAIVHSPGFFRSLLKATGVVASGVAGAAAGPGGAAVGALAFATYANSLNMSGPGPGRQWLISDARIYQSIQVAGVGEILPAVLARAENNTANTFAISPTSSISFVQPGVFPTRALDSNLNPITTIDGIDTFVLNVENGTQMDHFFGSVVYNTIGFPNSRPLTSTDYLDIELGSLLTVPNGTLITYYSTPNIGFSSIPEPSGLCLGGIGLGSLAIYYHSQRRTTRRWGQT